MYLFIYVSIIFCIIIYVLLHTFIYKIHYLIVALLQCSKIADFTIIATPTKY